MRRKEVEEAPAGGGSRRRDEADEGDEPQHAPPSRAETARYGMQLTLAHRLLHEGQPGRARALLDVCAPELRGWEHRFLSALHRRREFVVRSQLFRGPLLRCRPNLPAQRFPLLVAEALGIDRPRKFCRI